MIDSTVKHNNFNPTRRSIWNDPQVKKQIQPWGSHPGEYKEVVDLLYDKYGDIRWTPNPDVTTVGDLWADALHETYARQKPAAKALSDAAKRINRVMKKWRIALGIKD